MPNSGSTRQKWLTAYRYATLIMLVVIMVGLGLLLRRDSKTTITAGQADKVGQTASYLETVGFGNPTYLGIAPGAEGEYPTFRATAIGGESVDLWIRTTRNGGLEIQPVGVFQSIYSADDFASLASKAVYDWEHIPSDIKPRTDGAYGEYESRKYDYDHLAKYKPSDSYEQTAREETSGWPRT